MPATPTLPAALLHHAALGGEEPWLFRAEGWDWRWHPWGEVARWVTAWAQALSSLPPASRTAFSYAPRPVAVALDLAIQAAGLVPVPVSGPAEGRDALFWVEIEGEAGIPAPEGMEIVRVGIPSKVSPIGGVVERTGGGWEEMAERVQAEIGMPLRKGLREIVVLSGPLERPEERAMLSWATVAGAAVVLEPNPALRVATAAWVRPTVFHGTAEELGGLRGWVEKEGKGFWRRGPGLPFRRLRTVLVAGDEALDGGSEAFWRERSVRVGRVLDLP
ncbi:MAG TPA: hypothetical protein VKK31_13380 [Thermoanaerobaculia bacterium]|nr:hypothetical protein [Thermoanaerobaculia bacterium]